MKKKLFQMMTLMMLSGIIVLQSCKKEEDERTPPGIKFKTGAGYTSANTVVNADTTILVGITVSQTEDELRTFNVSYAYDGAANTTTYSTQSITGSEVSGFSRDINVHTRATAGTEKWVFTTTDKDGNVASVNLVLTVQ